MTDASDLPCPLPLHRIAVPALGPPRPLTLPAGATVWHVTRYEEVRKVLTDPRFTRVGVFGAGAEDVDEIARRWAVLNGKARREAAE